MEGDGVQDDPSLVGFCQAVHPRLLAALLVTTRDREMAEEVAQETVVRICERWPAVREMAHPEGWVFRVALNLVRSRWRRTATAARVLRRLQSLTDPVDEQPDIVTRDWVRAAVAELPARQRQVIALRYTAGLPVADTAVAMGCAEGTVKSLTAKATAKLRARLQPDLLDDPAPERSAPERSAPERSAPERSAPERSAPDPDQTAPAGHVAAGGTT